MFNKKGLGPVVATALLLVVAVAAVVSFQSWFFTYSNSMYVNTETQSNINSQVSIETIVGDTLYVRSPKDNLSINKIQVGEIDCNINTNLSKGMNNISIGSCLSSVSSLTPDIVLILETEIVEKTLYLEETEGNSFSGWCYQETANESYILDGGCNLDYSGSYSCEMGVDSCSEGFDTNWSTVHSLTADTGQKYIYFNYTKPINAILGSKLLIEIVEAGGTHGPANHTISEACWNEYQDKIQFRMEFNWGACFGNCYSTVVACYGNSTWNQLANGREGGLYEEAMIWNISN